MEQIITNKDRLPFYSENEHEYNWNKELEDLKNFFRFFFPLAHIVTHYKFDIECYGMENIPKKGGIMVACNHVAGLDPISLTYAACKGGRLRSWYFMAKEEFFHVFFIRIPLSKFGGFPVKRGTPDRKSLDFAIRVLKEGQGLLVFPEGTRNKERTRPDVDNAKSGVALIAREAKCDVLPVSIHMEPRKKNYNGKRGKPKYIIRFGEVIPYKDLGLGDKPKSKQLKAATKMIMEHICEEWDKDVLE